MISCDEVLDRLPEAVPVLLGDALTVHEHLKICADCQEEADQVAHTLNVLTGEADPAPELSDDFADKVLAALPAAAAPAPAAPAAPAGEVIQLAPAFPLWLQAAAAAAVFACGIGVARLMQKPEAPSTPQTAGLTSDTPQPAPVTTPQQRRQVRPIPVAAAGDPIGTYVSEASLVLQAVDSLDAGDPKVLTLLRKHLERTALLEQGERLMIVLDRDPRRGKTLRPLIRGTQLILRKVRHSESQDARRAAWAIRQEVRQTRILDAYRNLTRPTPDDAQPNQPGVINVNDPL